jgi:hypothetical protein
MVHHHLEQAQLSRESRRYGDGSHVSGEGISAAADVAFWPDADQDPT